MGSTIHTATKPESKTTDLVVGLYGGKGALTGDALDAALSLLKSEHTAQVAAETGHKEATDALARVREEQKRHAEAMATHRATVARIVFVLCDATVRGERSATQREVASVLGVSQPNVSKILAVGRALHRVSPVGKALVTGKDVAAHAALHTAREQSADTLARVADAIASGTRPSEALAAERESATTERPDVRVATLLRQVERLTDTVKGAGRFVGDAETRDALVKAVARLADVVGGIRLADPTEGVENKTLKAERANK